MAKAVKYIGQPEQLAMAIRQYIGTKPHDEVAHMIRAMEANSKTWFEAQPETPTPPPPPPAAETPATPPVVDPAASEKKD